MNYFVLGDNRLIACIELFYTCIVCGVYVTMDYLCIVGDIILSYDVFVYVTYDIRSQRNFFQKISL